MRPAWKRIASCLVGTGVLLSGGCAPSNVYVAKNFRPLGRIALMPLANDSNDLDASGFVRGVIFQAMQGLGFQMIPLAEIDQKLNEQGFTDGGQLNATTPQKLGEWTGADTVLFATVEDFNYITLGFYWQRKVTVSGRLMDPKTGERLWETEKSFSTRGVAVNKKDAEKQFAVQLAIKMAEKLAHAPLGPETREVVRQMVFSIPR